MNPSNLTIGCNVECRVIKLYIVKIKTKIMRTRIFRRIFLEEKSGKGEGLTNVILKELLLRINYLSNHK